MSSFPALSREAKLVAFEQLLRDIFGDAIDAVHFDPESPVSRLGQQKKIPCIRVGVVQDANQGNTLGSRIQDKAAEVAREVYSIRPPLVQVYG